MAGIDETVRNDPLVRQAIDELLEKRFLVPGVFDSRAYLRDTERIAAAGKNQKLRINAIAMGAHLHNNLFYEITCDVLRGEEPEASKETLASLEKWRKKLQKNFPEEHEEIEKISGLIGQYLEFMNRKSQGF